MSEITVIEKPQEISYEQIHEILYAAHGENRKNGCVMTTANLSGEQLQKRIGDNGRCWVAMDADRPVGTISTRIVQRNKWYAKGSVADYMLAGVLPEYQGRKVNTKLAEKLFQFAKEEGFSIVELDTAEHNTHAIEVYRHQGFVLVDYRAMKGLDHYSVVMVKWLGQCPYTERYCRIRYEIKRLLVRARYKIGGIKRFGI